MAFAGGQVSAGPLRTEVTAVVAALPDGTVLRLGNPLTSQVETTVSDDRWTLRGYSRKWSIDIDGTAPIADAHILPVPIPAERRNVPGALESISVERCRSSSGDAAPSSGRTGHGWLLSSTAD
ncbi:hypothetical protein GCM10020255_061390 [Rhodococcus baikonurensis]